MKKIIPVFLVSCSVALCGAEAARESTLATYEQRIAEFARKKTGISEIFRPEDGIDEFEALLLAKVYFMQNFGFCGDVALPEKKGDSWIVAMFVGLPSQPTPPAIIDARSGRLRCEGHPDVIDAAAYMKEAQTPNQRLQGTPENAPSSSTEPEARRP